TLLELIHVAPAERAAIILPETGTRITYKQLRDQVTEMADALAALGIRRGDRVATVLPNGLPTIVSFLAASIAGTAAPLNPGYRQEEFRFFLEDTNARILLCPPDSADDARRAAETLKIPVYSLRTNEHGVVELDAPGAAGHSAAPPSPSDIALVLHTSGSTGRPKRVPIRHSNLAVSACNIVRTYALSP